MHTRTICRQGRRAVGGGASARIFNAALNLSARRGEPTLSAPEHPTPDSMTPIVAPLSSEDRVTWETLARGYKAFYKTEVSPSEYETTWNRLLEQDGVFGLCAKVDGKLVGFAHYLFHTSTWAPKV